MTLRRISLPWNVWSSKGTHYLPLFVLAVEVLAIAVRQNIDIRGISIDGQETKLLQYSDDTTATLADLSSARAFFDLLDTFKLLSGLKINYSKTEGM